MIHAAEAMVAENAICCQVRADLHERESIGEILRAWPPATPISVRIAPHAGLAEARDGDYFGPVLNRTARLLAAGHGGQILVSQATCDVGLQALSNHAALRALPEEGLTIRRELGDRRGIALAMGNPAHLSFSGEHFDEAHTLVV
ncbi:MAG: hypothetical protein IT521_04370 [Burkholderiales bacterium]|nr:hypothetical protein [Burkholderiales bacterium]